MEMAPPIRPAELEPIERASVDELRALQLQRLKWSLAHSYGNVPFYRQAFTAGWRGRRTRLHQLDQAGHSGGAMPHP